MTSSPDPPSTAEERFHLLVDSVTDYAIYMLDPSGRVTSWNPGAERIKGYQENEVLGKNFSIFYPADAIAAGQPAAGLRKAVTDGPYHEEGWRIRKNRTRFWAEVVITALRDRLGNLRGFAKVTKDATARKQMEDELRQTKESLAATLYSIGDGVIATDVNGSIVRLNPVAERLTGWPEVEARGKPVTAVFNIINEHTRRLVENPVDRVLREGLVIGLANHTSLISRDGTEHPIADSGAPIRGADGAIAGSVLVFRDVADERRAEQLLRESEERFRLLVNSVEGYAIYMLDPQGRVQSWNAGAARVKGYSNDEVMGRHFSIFYPPEDVRDGKPFRSLQVAASTGQYEEEGWRLRKDGTRFWANVTLIALHDENGKLHGFAKITRDFSQRRANEETTRRLLAEMAARRSMEEAQERLQESEERYRSQSEQLAVILQGIGDGVTVQDGAGRILYANDAAARTCGLASAQELLDIPAGELFHRFEVIDDANAPFPVDQLPGRRALAGEDSPRAIVGFRDKATGVERWSLLRANALNDANGRPYLAVNIWHDISEERRHNQEARFLSEASAILAASLDYATTLERVAQLAVPRLADWCAVDVLENDKLVSVAVAHVDVKKVELAKRLQERYPPDPDAPNGAAQVARSGVPELYPEIPDDLVVRSARGEEHLRMLRELGLHSAIVVPLVAGGRPLGTITLISAESKRRFGPTDLATAEELGRRAGMALDNSRHFRDAQDAIRVRDDFVSIAGHELKTPLAALQLQAGGLSRLLEREDGPPDLVRLRERLTKIGNQSRRLERLINELLDVSRITSGRLRLELEETDLTELAFEIVARFHEEGALQGADLRLDASGPVRGRWDRLRVDQVITNLISNAIKYGRKNPIDLTVSRKDGTALISVRDYGIGIDAAAQSRIFERFERAVAGRNYGGFGLGLWIARQIVEAHRGRIRVESAPELGATFIVELPCA